MVRGEDGVARYADRPRSLVEMLRRSVEARPEAEAVVELDGERLGYRELWDRASRVAGGLAERGIRPGDRVAIQLPNGLDWCLAFWGIQLAGAIAVPVNVRLAPPEVRYVVEDSGAAFSFEPGRALPEGAPRAVDERGPSDVAAIF